MFQENERVVTPGGAGIVLWVRMAAPDYDRPAAVSVLLDAKRDRFGYRGTVYAADDVQKLVN